MKIIKSRPSNLDDLVGRPIIFAHTPQADATLDQH